MDPNNLAGAASADRPVILIIDADHQDRTAMEVALARRFGADYRIVAVSSAEAGLDLLQGFARASNPVALIAVDLHLPPQGGLAFLERAHSVDRRPIRALLVDMEQRGTRIPFSALESLQRATALGRIDLSLLKGWSAPEELIYPQVQDALSTWTRANRPRHEVIRLIGERWSPRSHEIRDALVRNTVPFGFYAADSPEGQRLIDVHRVDTRRLPAVVFQDGSVLHDPSTLEVASALGVRTSPSRERYDLAIVGAGPAGLAASVYGASEGLQTLVIEPHAIGGQAGTSSMIRNYLGFPRGVSGGDLAFRAWEQSLLFGAEFVFTHSATGLAQRGTDRVIQLTTGQATAGAVIIASGVSYRRLGLPALERLVGKGVFYGAAGSEAPAMAGESVYVIGGANSAGQAALHLAKYAARVTLLVRGESLVTSMSEYLITHLDSTGNIDVRLHTRVVDGRGENRLEGLVLEDLITGTREEVPAAAVFVMIGAEPRTEWLRDVIALDAGGFVLTDRDLPPHSWPLARQPLPFETSLPGVFVVGDVRHGSVKRVAGAVGEGSVAVGSVHQYLAELER